MVWGRFRPMATRLYHLSPFPVVRGYLFRRFCNTASAAKGLSGCVLGRRAVGGRLVGFLLEKPRFTGCKSKGAGGP